MFKTTCAASLHRSRQTDRHATGAAIHTESHEAGVISILCPTFKQEYSMAQEKKKKWNNFFFSIYRGIRKSSADPAPCKLAFLTPEKHGNATFMRDIPSEI